MVLVGPYTNEAVGRSNKICCYKIYIASKERLARQIPSFFLPSPPVSTVICLSMHYRKFQRISSTRCCGRTVSVRSASLRELISPAYASEKVCSNLGRLADRAEEGLIRCYSSPLYLTIVEGLPKVIQTRQFSGILFGNWSMGT